MAQIYLLALVISLAAGLGLIFSRFKQPLLVSYVIAGAVLSAFHLIKPEQLEFLAILPEVGLAFLLFLVGMELDLREFRKLGKNILILTLGQVVLTTILVWFFTQNLIVGVAVAFTSTILVVKILLEEKEVSSLHGRLAIGSLLVEDLLAVILLMGIGVAASGQTSALSLVGVLAKGLGLIYFSLVSGKKILPGIFKLTANNGELLFLTAVSWCLLFVSLAIFAGFSLGIGAFLGGVSLAQSVFRLQISAKLKPLRDFFIMIFFLDLGTGLSISAVSANLGLGLGLLFFAVIIKPAIFILILSLLKYRAHTAFQTGIYVSSISEFSLIVVAMAAKLGFINPTLLSPVIFATVVSFIISSLEITHRRRIYQLLEKPLKKLERAESVIGRVVTNSQLKQNHAVLVGCHRAGEIVLKGLTPVYGQDTIVLDFNPETIEDLKNRGVDCVYGDVADLEVLDFLNLKKAQVVISTVRDLNDNLFLLDHLEKIQAQAIIILTAEDATQAVKLYERGAHYVSLPMDLEGHSLVRLVHEHVREPRWFGQEREKRLGELRRNMSSKN